MANFDYTNLVTLHNSSLVIQNKGTHTPITRGIVLNLRNDIDVLGEMLNQTGGSWTSNNYNWTYGDRYNLLATATLSLTYITDMRTACEDLSTTAGVTAPTWTISTASLNKLYNQGRIATISGTVLTKNDTDIDFSDVTDNTDYCFINEGTGASKGVYQITAHTADTITLSGYSGDSSAGDVEFSVLLSGNKSSYTEVRKESLIEDIRTAIIAIVEDVGTFRYFVERQAGSDSNAGTRSAPFSTIEKAITSANSTAGNIFLMARPDGTRAEFTNGATALTQANTTIQGAGTDSVIINCPSTATNALVGANGIAVNDCFFGNGTDSQGKHISGATGVIFNRCAFLKKQDTTNATCFQMLGAVTVTFNHCTFMGYPGGYGSATLGFLTGRDANYNDCIFLSFNSVFQPASSGGVVTTDNCAYYEYTLKKPASPAMTLTETNLETEADPLILDYTIGYLADTSPFIDKASDGKDTGAYPDSPYNQIRTASDSMTVTDSSISSSKHTVSETLYLFDEIATSVMNLQIDMPFWGLFETWGKTASSNSRYLPSTDSVFIGNNFGAAPEWEYDGAGFDLSWDNLGGDSFEVHVAVDDGVTDYDSVAWWEINGNNPSATTSQTTAGLGYVFNAAINTEDGSEWGESGVFSTATADVENDEVWDITCKIRVKNVATGTWSEVISITKNYAFNTFSGSMYYMGDNPRTVDNEYADHANYSLNGYHTTSGGDKLLYTRIDGVDWAQDDRRFAYCPSVKSWYFFKGGSTQSSQPDNTILSWWRYRRTPSGGISVSLHRKETQIYPCIFVNYGNYNVSSLHCFAVDTTNCVVDETFNSTKPIMSLSSTKSHYLVLDAVLGTDGVGHSSNGGFFVYMPSDELLSHAPTYRGKVNSYFNQLYYLEATYSGSGWEETSFWLHDQVTDFALGFEAPPAKWWFYRSEMYINDNGTSTQLGFLAGTTKSTVPF